MNIPLSLQSSYPNYPYHFCSSRYRGPCDYLWVFLIEASTQQNLQKVWIIRWLTKYLFIQANIPSSHPTYTFTYDLNNYDNL